MKIDIVLPLPEGWTAETEIQEDEDGVEVTHLEAHLPNDEKETDEGYIDIYAGEMPEDTTAQDQALSNYADMIGWDEDDEEDPITEWPFNNRKAYGFEALCDDDSPMRIMCIEMKKGVLCVMCLISRTDDGLADLVTMVERSLRLNVTD